MHNKFPKLAGHIRAKFIAGILVFFPILITFLVLQFIFNIIDHLFKPLVEFIPFISDHTTGVSAAVTLTLIYLAGLISSHILGKRVVNFFLQTIPQHIPVVNKIYTLVKSFTDAISPGNDEKLTGKVVFVQISLFDPQPKTIGLLTKVVTILDEDASGKLNWPGEPHGAVFFSSSPFPQTGQLIYVPLDRISELKVPVGNSGDTKDLWMTKKEFRRRMRQDEYMTIIASIATISSETFIRKPISVVDLKNEKPADQN